MEEGTESKYINANVKKKKKALKDTLELGHLAGSVG